MIGAWFRRRPRSAAEWFAARQGGLDARRERRFQDWLAADPAHAEDYALCEIAWAVSRDAAAGLPVPQPARTHRRLQRRLAAVAAVAAAAGLAILLWPAAAPQWSTGPGEQRALVLEDGSRVMLNTRTRIEARFARREREIVLVTGEAFFEVAKDPARPFIVRTALGSARAVGTRFNVFYDARRLAVTTEEGRVMVAGPAAGEVLVAAGRRAMLDATTTRVQVADTDVAATLNWMAQRIEADNQPLVQVLAEFSRYTPLPVRAATPEIGALRVSAVLRTGDIEALQAALNGAFGLDIERRADAFVVVAPPGRARPAPGGARE